MDRTKFLVVDLPTKPGWINHQSHQIIKHPASKNKVLWSVISVQLATPLPPLACTIRIMKLQKNLKKE
jgi:hypothetical protein